MARYAVVEVLVIGLLGVAATIIVAMSSAWWSLLPAVAALSLLGFYRDPPRMIRAQPTELVAPADGKVMLLQREHHAERGPVIRIVIFLSVFNVHINRSPCGGAVRNVKYSPGRYLNALRAEATAANESNSIAIDPRAPLPGPIHVRQIAGVLARRIVCTAQPGDELAAGERFGMIKLGSQTEITMPDDEAWDLRVDIGDRVKAGLTVLAVHGAPATSS